MNVTMRWFALVSAAMLATACTPGGTGGTASGGVLGSTGSVVRIDVSLTLYPAVQTPAGSALGYSPEITNVNVGDSIVFVNQDDFGNTATLIPGASTFPSLSPLTVSATSQSGNTLSQPWSSGALTQTGATSQPIAVDKAGVYLYGCFYHYDGRMRGEIVAQ